MTAYLTAYSTMLGRRSYGFYYDWTMILILIGAVICMIASAKVKSETAKYSKVRSVSGMTGAETARMILQKAGISGVAVRPVSGNLTDHYDPKTRTVNLGEESFNSSSITAISVAAHECGHAIQHECGYEPLKIRTAIVPAVNIGSQLALPIFFLGMLFSIPVLYTFGIVMFSLAVVFQLVTLPVEFDASHRAMGMLESTGILNVEERAGTRRVLTAAALTYVAALASSVLQLVRLILISRSNGGNRRK